MPKDETHRESKSLGLIYRPDGVLVLRNHVMSTSQAEAKAVGVPLEFPPTHEFSPDFLLEHTMDDTVKVSPTHIVLTLGNGRAVYRIRRDWMHEDGVIETEQVAKATGKAVGDPHTFQLSTGYWGELEEAEYFDADPVADDVYEAKTLHAEKHGDALFSECEKCAPVRDEAKSKVLARSARRANRAEAKSDG